MAQAIEPHEQSVSLTGKQRQFVQAYVGIARGNATEAARLAGYGGNADTLKSIACENLTKPYIRKAIDNLLIENTLTPLEIMARLTEHANATLADFIVTTENGWQFDLPAAREAGKLHLLKGASQGKHGTKVKLVDSQGALALLARCYGMTSEGVDPTVNLDAILQDLLEKIAEQREQQRAKGNRPSIAAAYPPDAP